MRYLTPLAMLTTALMVLSCSPLQQQQQHPRKEQADANKPPAPMYLGDVQQVYPAHGFALLRIIGPIPPAGVTLITHPADGSTSRMGNLVVSADASPRQGMVAADIRAGTVMSGDRVFQYRNIAPPEAEDGEKPITVAPITQPGTPTTPAGTTTTTPMQVHATRDDLPAKPATPAPAPTQPALPDPAPAATTQQPAQPTSPALPTGPINLPDLPDKAPNYLNDIPNDINQWN